MDKIDWCKKQNKGIKLVEQNLNLSIKYLDDANTDLETMLTLSGKWKNITAYYACYNALYAILQIIGIKCEIHDCSIALMDIIHLFNKEDYEFLKTLKLERINVQYYLKVPKTINEINVKEFVLKAKHIAQTITELDIINIRKKLN
jgi:hypothetical protein